MRSSVAQVSVKVKNQYPLSFIGEVSARNGYVVEQAKTTGFVGVSVVSGRSDQGKVSLRCRFHGGSYGINSRFITSRRGGGILVKMGGKATGVLNLLDVCVSVHQL